MKKYDLYFKETLIGSLTETNWDMRSYGDIIFAFDYLAEFPENPRLADFIKLSIKISQCLDEGRQEDEDKLCEEENNYLDLIETSDWLLVNDKGETEKTLCPMFHENNEITWQIDFK